MRAKHASAKSVRLSRSPSFFTKAEAVGGLRKNFGGFFKTFNSVRKKKEFIYFQDMKFAIFKILKNNSKKTKLKSFNLME